MGVLSTSLTTDATRSAAALTASDIIDAVKAHVTGDYGGHNAINVSATNFPITLVSPSQVGNYGAHDIPDSVCIRFLVNVGSDQYAVIVPAFARSGSSSMGVKTPPSFKGSSSNLTVGIGKPVSLKVDVSGSQPIFLQWRRNGTYIPGANSSVYAISNFQNSDAGNYDCIATNMAGQSTSSAQTLSLTGVTTGILTTTPNTAQPSYILTQAELDKLNLALYNLTQNLSAHVNGDLSVAHGISAFLGRYSDSSDDALGQVIIQFTIGTGSNATILYTPGFVTNIGPSRTTEGVDYVHTAPDGTFMSPGIPVTQRMLTTDLTAEILQDVTIYSNILAYHSSCGVGEPGNRLVHNGSAYYVVDNYDSLSHRVGRSTISIAINGIRYELVADKCPQGPPKGGPIIIEEDPFTIYHGGSSDQPFWALSNVSSPYIKIYTGAPTVLPVKFQWEYCVPTKFKIVGAGVGYEFSPWVPLGSALQMGGQTMDSGRTAGSFGGHLWWYTNVVDDGHCLLGGYSGGVYYPHGIREDGPSGIGLYMLVRCVASNIDGTASSKVWQMKVDGYRSGGWF